MEYIIKKQSELDSLDEKIVGDIIIDSPADTLIYISKKYVNASVFVRGVSLISVSDNCIIKYASDNCIIESASDNCIIESASDNCIIKNASDNCIIESASDNCIIKNAYGNCIIEYASGNCIVKIFNKSVKISACQESVIICMNHKRKKGYNYVYRKTATYDIKSFLSIYNLKPMKGKIVLYKSVNNNDRDFYTNTIEYRKGVVICPDFDSNKNRECGGGLHLSPTPELALKFNDGKLKKCRVCIKDIVVYPHNIEKVRCRKVEVLE